MRYIRTTLLAGFVTLCILTNDSLANDIETLYIIGLPASEVTTNLPPEAIVISREQLVRFGSASLATILEQVPGISINQNGGRGSFNGLFLRGADPNFTQVRIDGVPINNATNTRGGAFDISSINAQIIERIEIISDASSALYGSQALAGVINIVTRLSGFEAAVEIDSHGGEVTSAFLAGDNLAFSVIRERPESAFEGSLYESDELGMKANWQWLDAHRLQVVGRHQRYNSQAFPDDSGGSIFATSDELESRTGKINHLAAHYAFQTSSGDLFEINSSFFNQTEDRSSPTIAPGLRDPFGLPEIIEQTDYARTSIEARYSKELTESVRWRTALAWEQEQGQQSGQLDFSFFQVPTDFDLKRKAISFTQSLELSLSPQFKTVLSAGLVDTESDTVTSPRLSLSYAFDNNTQLIYTTLGEGFKQASIYALADPLIGSTDLLDETASSMQIGHRVNKGNWTAKHNAYFYEYENLIDFDAGPPPSLINRDKVRINGVESTISYKRQQWSIDVFQSYNSHNIVGSTQRLRQRPRYRAGVQANYELNDRLSIWAKNLYIDKRLDSSIPTADLILPSYSVSDLGLRWQFSQNWQMNAQWKNIFSKRYSHSIGNPINGDTLLLQLTYRGEKLF
ncbi:MAG: outer membrane receptor protein involved in Fe transport [Gammaproteobacteria bacterium]|jgi:outer membrane receptor protein involved in Fe transport